MPTMAAARFSEANTISAAPPQLEPPRSIEPGTHIMTQRKLILFIITNLLNSLSNLRLEARNADGLAPIIDTIFCGRLGVI